MPLIMFVSSSFNTYVNLPKKIIKMTFIVQNISVASKTKRKEKREKQKKNRSK